MNIANAIERETEIRETHPIRWLTATILLGLTAWTSGNCMSNSNDIYDKTAQQIQTEWFNGLTTNQIDELGRASARVRIFGSNPDNQVVFDKYDAMRKEFRAYHPQQQLLTLSLQNSFMAGLLGGLSGVATLFAGYKFWKS